MKPLKFKPIFMERIWGGTALRDKFGFDIHEGKKIGELWTISDNRTAVSVICLLYTSPSPRDRQKSRMPSSA